MNHIIFDFNGVIINDEPLHEYSFKQAILHVYNYKLSGIEYQKFFLGKTDTYGLQLFTAEHNLECKFELLKTIKNKIYFDEMNCIEIPIISGVVELIFSIKDDTILSLVTGSSKNEVEFILRRLGLFDKFHYKIYADDIINSKPHPEGYLKAIELSKISTDKTIVIEDSISGIISAKRAGLLCIAITSTHFFEELIKADKVLIDYSKHSLIDTLFFYGICFKC